jgi:hypothetical protein
MSTVDLATDTEKLSILLIVEKLSKIKPFLGAYIEHFMITEQDILVKLTNGFFKIKTSSLSTLSQSPNNIPCLELQRIAKQYISHSL